MKRKIIGILVCTLLIATTLPVATSMTVSQTNEENAGIVSSGNDHPIAKFTWMALGYFPFFIVDGRGSSDGDGRIVKYEWQWDEGGSYQSTLRYPRWFHYYGNRQPHKITLKVTDNDGSIDLVTHVVFPRPIGGQKGSYSATYISQYDHWVFEDLPKKDLDEQVTELKYIMRGAGWQQKFFKTDGSVTEGTFTNDVSTSNFHYHCGHGIYDWTGDFITELALKDWWPLPNNNDVRPQDVEDKWDDQCKWVWLHSCHILEDDESGLPGHYTNYFRARWATVLNTCHMVLGFASKTTLSTSVVTEFFYNAMGGMHIAAAYKAAREKCYSYYQGNRIYGAYIADTEAQATNDHLYGYGTVQADEDDDDDTYWWYKWGC